MSEASSGYMSTSLSAATLSDVYTLSWDLPPTSGFEMVPDEEDEDTGVANFVADLEPTSVDTSAPPSLNDKADGHEENSSPVTDSNAGQKECRRLPSVQTHEADSDARPESTTTEQVESNRPEPLHDLSVLQESEGKRCEVSEPRSLESENVLTERAVAEEVLEGEREAGQDPAPSVSPVLSAEPAPAPEPPVEPALPDLNSTSSGRTVQQQSPADASAAVTAAPNVASSVSAANPFKIQKVKSSDLKSFHQILDEENPGNVDPDGSTNLSVPMESLEIISDSEEGDAANSTELPEWLKEGEFVTVGTNKNGTVRYVGPADFAPGIWVGVELEVPAGESTELI